MSEPMDERDALEVLRDLVQQIRGSEYRDRLGHPLENNVAFLEAVALLKLRGLAKTTPPDQTP